MGSLCRITCTWGANGNLLSDVVNTYAYDKANRLKSFTGASLSTSYAYNGLGDRMQQTVNGVPQTYLLDTASGLTQVLADNTHTYLYGVDRVSQQGITVTEYFLGDALGSVRQLVDASGNVTLAKSYQPYGEVLDSEGGGESNYGFTNEWEDKTGMEYLRSRYYAPASGRFINKDTWQGYVQSPLSLNRWNYVQGNPINFSDPTGYIEQGEAKKADGIQAYLESKGLLIEKDWGEFTIYAPDPLKNYCGWNPGIWKIRELELIEQATNDVDRVLRGKILSAVRKAVVNKDRLGLDSMAPPGMFSPLLGDIVLSDLGSDELEYKWEFAHEYGHVWDYRSGSQLSFGLMKELGTWICRSGPDPKAPECDWFPYHPTIDPSTGKTSYPEPPPDTKPGCETSPPGLITTKPGCEGFPYSSTYGQAPFFTGPGAEDWANSFAFFIYRNYQSKSYIGIIWTPIREKYVQKQISRLH